MVQLPGLPGYDVMVRGRNSGPSPHLQRGDRHAQFSMPQSPPSPSFSEGSGSPLSPGNSRGVPKVCGVCGDVAKSMHFGGLSCDSCKAFFRRSVQNNVYKGFTCPYEKKCTISISSRKACQYCRFYKCLSVGMEKGWVMTEDERKRMMTQRQERKQKQLQEEMEQRHQEAQNQVAYSLSETDKEEIAHIDTLYNKAYVDIPYEDMSESNTEAAVMVPWITFCKRMGYFFSLFQEFLELSGNDQTLLLKTAITSACIIMGTVVYDAPNKQWAGRNTSFGYMPQVKNKSVENVVPQDMLTRVENFFKKFQTVCPDETMAKILILVSLYSPELMGLEARDKIQSLQDRYVHILHRYVRYKFREKSSLMFPKAIVSLADIRELAERTSQVKLQRHCASTVNHIVPGIEVPSCSLKVDSSLLSSYSMYHRESEEYQDARLARLGVNLNSRSRHIIKKVLELVAASPVHFRCSTLLPLLVKIMQNIGANGSSFSNNRAITSGSGKGVVQRRFGNKKRIVEIVDVKDEIDIKQEVIEMEALDSSNSLEFITDMNPELNSPCSSHSAPGSSEHKSPEYTSSFSSHGLLRAGYSAAYQSHGSPVEYHGIIDSPPTECMESDSSNSSEGHMGAVYPEKRPKLQQYNGSHHSDHNFYQISDSVVPYTEHTSYYTTGSQTEPSTPGQPEISPGEEPTQVMNSIEFSAEVSEKITAILVKFMKYLPNGEDLQNAQSLEELIPVEAQTQIQNELRSCLN